VIRFSAFLVVVAVGLLVAGVVTSKLLLVYIAIGVSGVALLALGIGAAVNWRELTSKPGTADTSAQGPAPVPPDSVSIQPDSVPVPPEPVPAVTAPAPVTATSITPGPSRAGYLPTAEPPRAKPAAAPAPAAFTARRETPAPGAWEWRDDSVPAPSPPAPASAAAEAPAPPPTDAKGTPEPTAAAPEPTAVAPEPTGAAPEPEPESGIDPELTLVTAITPEHDKKPGEAEPVGPDPSMEVTVVPGVPRYHNARCILIRFMGDSDLDKITLAAARDAGCTPCRACLPDQPEKSPE
jgi:hypothetical protein